MNTKLIYAAFFVLFVDVVLCAQVDSIPIGMITYSHQVNLAADYENNGFSTLFFNATNSIYIHNSAPPADSIAQDDPYSSRFITGDVEGVYRSPQ